MDNHKVQNYIQNFYKHPFHLVNVSPWPILLSFGLFFFLVGLVMWLHNYNDSISLMFIGQSLIIFTMYTWWRDMVREVTYEGNHTKKVQTGLRQGVILFIISEIMFFFSFFWAFFHSALAPTVALYSVWPPLGIEILSPWSIPLLNTGLLLSSGGSVTVAHHLIINNKFKDSIKYLILTIVLAVFFIALQAFEYVHTSFTISTSVYGSVFYLITGFHGLHVIIGTIFLLVCLIRLIKHHFTTKNHFGFEAAIWYWHFVDIVWLFLFITVYWWGGH